MPKARLVFDGDNVYIGKDARIYWLKDDIASKIDEIPWVINSLDSTSTTDALSANMGRTLQDQINWLSWTWKFLSTWDCTTWLPGTNPQEDPYTYKVWDYYVVSATGSTNYKPHWGAYTQWVPSTTVELENVWVNDKYYFDWADWVRIPDTAVQISIDTALSTTSTNAVENRAIATAINAKQDTISDLSTIRNWASKWATALQPNDNISQLTNNVGYQTAGDVASAIAWKQDILTAWDWISLSSNTVTNTKPWPAISSTAPANPTEWMLWYDSTNDVLKVYDGSAWQEVGSDAADINTKTFYLSSTSDLTNAQAAYDWYLAGGNPIVLYQNRAYIVYDKQPTLLDFSAAWNVTHGTLLQSSSRTLLAGLQFYLNSNTVTWIDNSSHEIISWYLEINKNYSTPYIPQYDWSPATKKYVDDSVAGVISSWGTAPQNPQEWDLRYDTVNHVLKIYNWTSWETVDTDSDTTYTAWNGINISAQNEISADTSVVATQWDIPTTVAELSDSNDYATKTYVDDAIDNISHTWSTAPVNPTEWQLWYDTTNDKLYVYDGSNWIELWTMSGLITWTTFGAFSRACLAAWTVHNTTLSKYRKPSWSQIISNAWTATYTMQWIWFFVWNWWSANDWMVSIAVNWLTIWSETNSSWNYSMKYLNTPITLSPGDEVSVTMSQYGNWDIYANISDFY